MRAFSGIFQGTKRNAFGSQCAFGMLPSSGAVFPSDIPGLLWRLESTLITGIADGNPLEDWLDASGNDNAVSQPTLARRPIYNATDLDWGGKPSLTFDGVDDSMSFGSPLQPVSLFIAAKNGGNPFINVGRYISSASGNSAIYDNLSQTKIWFNEGITTDYALVTTPVLWETHSNGVADTLIIKNGSENNRGVRPIWQNQTYTLGDFTSGGGQCLGGTIAACIAYSGFLSPTDRGRVRQYLNDVYFGGVLP